MRWAMPRSCPPADASCSQSPWTPGAASRGGGQHPDDDDFDEAACDDPSCFPDMWLWASTPSEEHGLVVAGSVSGSLIQVTGGSLSRRAAPARQRVGNGGPVEERFR